MLILDTRAKAEQQLAQYAAIRSELEAELAAGDPNAKYFLITLAAGEATSTALIAWTEEALGLLDR